MHTGARCTSVRRQTQQPLANRWRRQDAKAFLARAWKRVTSFAAAVADVARETRELETHLLRQRGHHRFLDS